MSFNTIRKLIQTPVHGLVAMAFVVAVGTSAISFVMQQTNDFEPYEKVQAVSHAKARTAVLGVSTPVVVTWTNLTKVIAEGGDLEQIAGNCVGCADAGANSVQQITSGDGYFEFTIAPGTYHYVYAGLNTDLSASTAIGMPFALEVSGSYVSVREQGTYKSDTPFKAGDVFRVSIESGVVKYYKNGSVFYTSAATPIYPLVADVSMQSVGSLLWAGKIAVGEAAPVVPPAPTPAPPANEPTPVQPAPAPTTLEIRDIGITNVTATSATVSWVTTLPADSYVRFGTTTRMTRSARNSGLVINHVFQLTGLLPNRTYYYQVRSKTGAVTKTSTRASFKTTVAAPTPTPVPPPSPTPVPPPAPTPTPPPPSPTPTPTPTISSFTASPASVTAGQTSTLSWNVTGATSLSINQNIGTVTGTTSKVVTPAATTIYTLTATNSAGAVTSNVTVNVNTVVVPPPTTSTVELPRVYVNSTYPTLPANRTIRSVKASCSGVANCYTDFQAALDAANPGDEVVIDAGLQLLAPDGGFILRNGSKSNPSGYYTVVRSANIANLPTSGSRVSPSYASQMPKILSNGVTPAIISSGPASYIRFVGVEVSLTANAAADANAGGATSYNLVLLGSSSETNAANLPHHIIFDRVYVHGAPTKNVRRGFYFNTGAVAVVDSYVSDFHEIGADTQAILGANGTGPYKVVNNYLEAAGENLLVGGLDVPIMPSDFEIRSNYFYKPTKWMIGSPDYAGYAWVVKNLFETKFGLRWLVDGNIFENNWPMGQTGMAINLKSSNQDGTMSFAETAHFTFTNNVIRHSTWAVQVHSKDAYSGGTAVNLNHLYIANNVFDDIGVWGSANTLQQDETPYVTFDHNTFLNERNNSAFVLYGNPSSNFVFTNNILGLGLYGIKGDSQASGTPSINQFLPGSVFSKNVFYGANTSPYPAGNYMVSSASGVGFTSYNNGNGGNYALTSSSAYKNGGTDGKDPGADMNALTAATACAVSGNCGGYTPPVNPPSPVPTISSFAASPASVTTGQASTLSWNVSGATSLSLNQNIGTVTGTSSKVVTPTTTTTYTLTAANNSGSVTASVTVVVSTAAPTSLVDGYGDTLSASQFTGWFFSQVGDTSATITYENVNDVTKTYTQTAARTVTRTDAEGWLRTTYGSNFAITQPLGFVINPSSVVTAPGTYRIKSFKLNTSNTIISLGAGAQTTFTISSAPPAGAATVTVNAAQRYQTMNGWEAVSQSGALLESNATNGQSNINPSFAQYKNSLYDQAAADGINRLRLELYSYTENSTDYFSQYVNGQISFDTLKTKWYQVVNDNADVNSINASGFKFSQLDFDIDNYILPMKQRLEAKGEQLAVNLCFVHFSASSSVHSTNGNEYGELMLATFQHIQSKYGFVPATIELMLEPDNGTPFNGTNLGNAMLGTQSKLAAAGFTPKFILPSTTSMQNTVSYFDAAKNVVGAPFITQYVEEISYHLYGGYSSTTAANILSRANQYGIKTSQLEYIGANVDNLLQDLTQANVSAWEEFVLAFPGASDDGGAYYMINGTTVTPASRMKLLRQYFKFVRKGAVRVGVASASSALNPVAFENTNGKQVVVVKSTGSSAFSIGGIAAGTYGVMHTVNGITTNAADVVLASGQNLSTSIPGAGVITIYAK